MSDYHKISTYNFSDLKKEQINCPVCSANQYVNLFTSRSLNFVRCNICGLWYVNPMVVDSELYKFYQGGLARWASEEDYLEQKSSLIEYYGLLISQYGSLTSVFDYGCGIGSFLDHLRERSIRGVGYEVSSSDLSECYKKQLEVYSDEEDLHRFSGFFASASMLDVIEHLTHPTYALRTIHGLLEPHGILLIHTGSIGGIGPRIRRGRYPFVLNEGHVCLYSPKSIRYLLKETGFVVVDIISEIQYHKFVENKYPSQDRSTKYSLKSLFRRLYSTPDMFVIAKKSYENEK